ncbi:MAG: ABC transporter permease [Candidatus Omnitrophica bacterium]|nr:ABC transporter permease [Candidatus Omnitrophota bacterium]
MKMVIRELFSRKDLIKELVSRDLRVRYSRPYLGFLWTFLSPFFTATVFYFVFSIFLKVRIEGVPFFLYLLSAIFAWSFFQDSLINSSTSLIQNKNLIRESNFPHYLIPVAIVTANMVNLLPSLVVTIVICALTIKGIPFFVLLLPLVIVLHWGTTVGLSIIFSIIYVRWRDIRYLLEVALLFLFYLTPVVYSLTMVREALPMSAFIIYMCNPFVAILNLYRISILKGFYLLIREYATVMNMMLAVVLFACAALIAGFCMYQRTKRWINDYLSY